MKKKIEKYIKQLEGLSGRRRQLVDILVDTQETLEENLNWGLEPTLSQLGFTIEEAEEEFEGEESEDDEDGGEEEEDEEEEEEDDK